MSKLADQLVFVLFAASLPLITVVDGSRNVVLAAMVVIGYEVLLLVWLVTGWRHTHLRTVARAYRWLWILLGLWLAYGFVRALVPIGGGSLDAYSSYGAMLMNTGYVCVLLLATLLLRNLFRVRVLIVLLVALGVVQAIFGLLNYYGDSPVLGWSPTHWAAIRVTGTYVNRNFFANLLVMILGFVLVPLLYPPRRAPAEAGIRGDEPGWLAETLPRIAALLVLVVLVLAGLFLSGSRAGFVCLLTSLLFVVGLVFLKRRSGPSLIALAMAALGTLFLFGSGILSGRLQRLDQAASSRWEQWVPTFELIVRKWLLGYGPGTYEQAFRTRTTGELGPMTFNHAHNDYLELLVNQGAIGMLLLGAAIAGSLLVIVRKTFSSRSRTRERLLLGVLFGVVAMLTHAAMDFPFQVPANTVIFLVLVAMGLNLVIMPMTRGGTADR